MDHALWPRRTVAALTISVLVASGCNLFKKSPTGPEDEGPPGVPKVTTLRAFPGNGTIEIAWSPPDTQGTLAYHVYRAVDGGGFDSIATTSATRFTDSGLGNEQQYGYRITVVLNGIVGDTSDVTVTAVPYAYGLVLNSGRTITNKTAIPVGFVVRTGTTAVALSNSAGIPDTAQTTASPSGVSAWMLSDGDGQKTVYARFRDAEGNLTLEVSASLTKDSAELSLPPGPPEGKAAPPSAL